MKLHILYMSSLKVFTDYAVCEKNLFSYGILCFFAYKEA